MCQGFRQCAAVVKLSSLDRRQSPVKHRELIDQAVLEATVAKSLADGQLVTTSACDILGQCIANDLAVGPAAVEIQSSARWPGSSRRRSS